MRFNSRGEYHGGRVGIGSWLTDDQWLTQAEIGSAWLACGGNRWVDSTQTARSNFDYAYPAGLVAKVWDMALDGTVCEVPNYHMPYNCGVWPNRELYPDFDQPVMFARAVEGGHFIALIGYQRVWSSRHGWIALPPAIQAFEIAMAGDVLCFTTHLHLVLLHVVTGLGRVVAGAPAFYPDLFAQPGGVTVGYGLDPGDASVVLVTVALTDLTDELGDLTDTVTPPIEPPIEPPVEPVEPEEPDIDEPDVEPEPEPEPPPSYLPPPGGLYMHTIAISEPAFLNWRYGGGQSLDPPTNPDDANRDPFEHGRVDTGPDELCHVYQFADGTYGLRSPNKRSWLSVQADASYEERPASDDAEPGPWERFTLAGNVLTEVAKPDMTRDPVTFVQP